MTSDNRFVRDDVRGRQRRRLDPKFLIVCFSFAEGLRERLLADCGDRDAFGFALGRALHLHACGIFGPVARSDSLLNRYILDRRSEPHPHGRWVISRHRVGSALIEIATDITSGATRIRLPTRFTASATANEAKRSDRSRI